MNADDVETILTDFRAWLLEAKEIPAPTPTEPLDVATVVQHFIALRQEVNLQTKASRAQLEQNVETLAVLQQALEGLQASDTTAAHESLRPLLKTLIDAHDALSLAQREVQRLLDAPVPSRLAAVTPPAIDIRLPFWARWLGLGATIDEQLASLRAWRPPPEPDDMAQRSRQVLDALLVGYSMSLQRIERALEQHGLEAITCLGQPFDPEAMEVAEVMREEGRASTEVLQEIRRGYRWHGKLFRYAQVRVAKP